MGPTTLLILSSLDAMEKRKPGLAFLLSAEGWLRLGCGNIPHHLLLKTSERLESEENYGARMEFNGRGPA